SGPGVRVDSGVAAGYEVPQAYDSLIAKLICTGRGREEAIARTLRALDEFQIEGIKTTLPFHRVVIGSEWFQAGRFSTKTVEEELDLSSLGSDSQRPLGPAGRIASRGPAHSTDAGEESLTVELEGKRFQVKVMGRAGGERRKPSPPDLERRSLVGRAGELITAPMQGTIIKVLKAEGDRVSSGDAILVLEAMKMENLIVCHRDGVVGELRVAPGDTVNAGAAMAMIGPPEAL
ncbi:MAG: biotin/lipoyl-containing protein, partial [Candidatus Methylomirabilales bacterium]